MIGVSRFIRLKGLHFVNAFTAVSLLKTAEQAPESTGAKRGVGAYDEAVY